MSTDTEVFLEHYGVMGMHWGVRKDNPAKQAMTDAKSDRKIKNKLTNGPSYKGIVADRKAHIDKMKARMATDPEYKKAVQKIDKNEITAINLAVTAALGIYVVAAMGPTLIELAHSPAMVYKVNKGIHFVSRKIMTKFPGGVFKPSPKKSQYWTKDTVRGSATAVGTAVELYRKYG